MLDSTIPTKRCKTCGSEYPATTEYFYASKTEKYGVMGHCKSCKISYQREHGSKPEVIARRKQWDKEYRQRPEVKEHRKEYLITYTRRSDVSAHRKEYTAEYYRKHKEHLQQIMKEHSALPEVKAKRNEYLREYRQRPEAKEKIRISRRKYDEKPEAKSLKRELTKAYNQRPDVKVAKRLHTQKRRISACGVVTPQDVELQLTSQKGRCWHCGKKIKGNDYHIDHLVPLARGGKHEPRNIVISCPRCNQSKHDKMTWEWNGRLF